MANDFECTRCGYREAPHECAAWEPETWPGICKSYRRSREEIAFDRRAKKQAEREAANRPINHTVLMITSHGIFDIGS